jgi:probable HAF family extracellular repeat protein
MRDLGTLPGATNSDATGINNSGEIVGYTTNADNGGSQAFVYRNRKMQDIGTLPGDNQAEALGINNRGEIVGWSYNFLSSGGLGGTFGHAYLYKNGTMTDLGTLQGLNDSVAVALNNRGEVIGYSFLEQLGGGGNAPYESWIFENGRLVDLGALPGALQTIVGGINNQGTIVGSSYGSNSWTAVLFDRNGVSDLNNLIDPNSGWILEFANGINDRGQIVGEGIHDGLFSAYLLTPR